MKVIKKYNILFADDNPADILVLKSVLINEEYNISSASNGEEAIEKIKRGNFDLILLDILMPKIDGLEVCKEVKANKLSDAPIIFVTSLAKTESIVQGFVYGAVDYITKPFNKHELLARVKTHLELRYSKLELKIELENRIKTEKYINFLASIVRFSEDLAVIKDLNLKVIAANQSWIKATGTDKISSLLGKSDNEIFSKNDFVNQAMEDDRKAQKLKSGNFIEREETIIYPSGEKIILSTKKFPVFNDDNSLIGTASISRDITQNKKYEEKLQQLNKDLEKRVEERTKELSKELLNRKKLDKAFKESEQRYKDLYNNAPIGLFKAKINGDFVTGNKALLNTLGIKNKDSIEKSNFLNNCFNETKKRNAFLSEINNSGFVTGYAAIWEREKGDKIHISISAKSMLNKKGDLSFYEGSIEDVTQTKLAREELTIKEKQYRLLFDNMSNGLILQEMLIGFNNEIIDFYYLEMNKALQKIMGDYYKPYKFVGRTLREAPLKIDEDWFEKCTEVAINGKQYRLENYITELDKYFSMIMYQPQYGQVATIINDITERKKSEEKIHEQYQQIKIQKDIIEIRNNSITESINYAQRIQSSMLPKLRSIKPHFEDIFIFYKPKDIVSGDFYWFSRQKGKTIIAAIDCTGHGVPGGYLSMMGNDMLNVIVNLQGITETDKILNLLHKRMRQNLAKSDNEILDGMDIGICCIDKVKNTLQYSGSKIPLVYIQNGKLRKIRGDYLSIAVLKLPRSQFYTKHEIDISTPTSIYLSTDGYQDQYGGKRKRKFYPQQFEKLLQSIHKKSCNEQKIKIKKTMKSWMKTYDQLDDMLIIGAKI